MHFSVPRKSWIFSKIWQIVLVLISPLVLSAIFVIILYIVPVIISSMVMIQYGKFLIFLYNCQWHCVNHYRKVNHGLYFLAVSDISWILFLMLLTRYLSSYFSILCVIVIVPNNTQQPRFCVVAGAGPGRRSYWSYQRTLLILKMSSIACEKEKMKNDEN